jgi:hypothetical protein
MLDIEQEEMRKFRFKKPTKPEETLSAIHEELSLPPLSEYDRYPMQTVKGYLRQIFEQLRTDSRELKRGEEERKRSEAASLAACGLFGLLLVLASAKVSSDWPWWREYSYFFFVFGTVLTVMFVAASMERSSVIARMLTFNSVKIVFAFVFSGGLIYASSQASSLLNAIFGIDAANLLYTRAILSAVYFLKICQPFVLVLVAFVLIHFITVWVATKISGDIVSLPWNSILFILGSVLVAASFWWITHGAFGDEQIKQKAYKLAHYLDFSSTAYCVTSPSEQRYLFFGQDHNKVLIDRKLYVEESFEEFLKGTSTPGSVTVPAAFTIQTCSPAQPGSAAAAPLPH